MRATVLDVIFDDAGKVGYRQRKCEQTSSIVSARSHSRKVGTGKAQAVQKNKIAQQFSLEKNNEKAGISSLRHKPNKYTCFILNFL